MARIAVVGSRDFPHLAAVRKFVLGLPKGTTVVSGGARGVDREAELAAFDAGHEVLILFADWKTHGKRAGLIRNVQIVECADVVMAFHDGKSTGTMHTVSLAKQAGKPCEVYVCKRAPKGVSDNPGVLKPLPQGFWKK